MGSGIWLYPMLSNWWGTHLEAFLLFFLRDGRDWGDHGRKLEGHQDRSWQGNVDGGMMGRDHERWQGTLAAYQRDCGFFLWIAATELLVVVKIHTELLTVTALQSKQAKFWEQGGWLNFPIKNAFLAFSPGGERGMPGQSGPGHVMNRGGMSG